MALALCHDTYHNATWQKVKKNRDNLKQLCGNIIEIMKVVQSHAHFYEDSDATKLENVCMDFER